MRTSDRQGKPHCCRFSGTIRAGATIAIVGRPSALASAGSVLRSSLRGADEFRESSECLGLAGRSVRQSSSKARLPSAIVAARVLWWKNWARRPEVRNSRPTQATTRKTVSIDNFIVLPCMFARRVPHNCQESSRRDSSQLANVCNDVLTVSSYDIPSYISLHSKK
jgi:hypothetical protein